MNEMTVKTSELIYILDERVRNLIQNNEEKHEEILKKINELCVHVNGELGAMNKRITTLEKSDLERKVTNKTLAKIGAMVVTVVTISISIIKLVMGI